MDTVTKSGERAAPWNKGKLLGQKPPLKLKEIWAIRIRLQLSRRSRELALFNLAIDSKLRGCDLVACASKMSSKAIGSLPAQSFCRRRPNGLFNSRSRKQRAIRLLPGWRQHT